MSQEISNSDNVIDSRNVIERISELEEWRDAAIERAKEIREEIAVRESTTMDDTSDLAGDLWTDGDGTEYGVTPDWDEDTVTELKVLKDLEEEASGSPDWRYGEILIRDSYFEDYAQKLAEDIGAVNRDARWPNNHIDWEAAADELKSDYSSVDFGGETYWIRS